MAQYPLSWADTRPRTAVVLPEDVTLKEALPEQPRINGPSLKRKQEHITLSPLLVERMGISRLRNLVIDRGDGYLKAVTLEQVWKEVDEDQNVARMHADGLGKLHLTTGDVPITATILRDVVPRADLSEAEAIAQGEIIESQHLGDTGAFSIVSLGMHGGEIEDYTHLQAQQVRDWFDANAATYDVTTWVTQGYTINDQTPSERWHITAENMYPESFPLLANMWPADNKDGVYDWVIGFHGYTDTNTINIGGLAAVATLDALVVALQTALPGTTVQRTTLDHIDGDAPGNVMNRIANVNKNTIQLEQSWDIRNTDWALIADTVAIFVRGLVP